MVFDKCKFIKRNNEFLYRRLEDFLGTEVDKNNFPILYTFLAMQNFKSGKYEGNQYLINKINIQEVQVIDIVSEEFCDDYSQTRFTIGVNELLELMDEMKGNM